MQACSTSYFSMDVETTVSLAGDDETANRQTTRNRRGSESAEARERRLAGDRARRRRRLASESAKEREM